MSETGLPHRIKTPGIHGEIGQRACVVEHLYKHRGHTAANRVEVAEALALAPAIFLEETQRIWLNSGEPWEGCSTMPASVRFDQSFTMNSTTAEESYRVWACDNQVYGPITLPVLAQWVQEGRVLRDTWIYLDGVKQWRPAGTIEVLHEHFPPGEATAFLKRQSAEGGGIDLEELRQFAVLSGLSNHDLAQLVRLGELRQHRPGEVILRRDEPGDALFFVLSGAVRARLVVGGDDKTLMRIPAGEFLGEMAMFTQSPRSADVVAESVTRLLRFTAEAFRLLIAENPAAAAPMLFAIARTMANRILAANQRFQQEVASEFVWR